MSREIYVSIDGDDIGRLLTQKIYADGEDVIITKFSKSVSHYFEHMSDSINQLNGDVLFCSGDSIFFKLPDEDLLNDLLASHCDQDFKISVGVGYTRKEAHWALNVSKSLGKDQLIHFNQIRHEIFQNSKQHLEE